MAGRLLGSNGSRYSCPRQSQWVNSSPGPFLASQDALARRCVPRPPALINSRPRDLVDPIWVIEMSRRTFMAIIAGVMVAACSSPSGTHGWSGSAQRYWLVSGVDVHFGLFPGLEINIESLRSRRTGSSASATRGDPNSPPARGRNAVPATRQAPEGVARMAAQDSDPAAERG